MPGQPRDTDVPALVEAAKKSLRWNLGQPDSVTHTLPEVKAISDAPDTVRRECILLTMRQKDADASLLMTHLARKQAGLTVEDVEAILSPPADPGESPDQWASYKEYVLVGQFETTWKLAEADGRARLRPLLERLAGDLSKPNSSVQTTATQLRRLITAEDDATRVPYELIGVLSVVAKALREAVQTAAEPDRVKTALVRLLTDYPVKGKPREAWRADAETVVGMLREPGDTITAVLDAAFSGPEIPGYHSSYGRFSRYGTERDEAVLCGTAVLAGRVAIRYPRLLPRLRRTALQAITGPGGGGSPRSIRLANHCVAAIADAGLPSSVTELLSIERGTRHGALVRAVRKSLDALAVAQGLTQDQLLELAVEDHGLDPDGTRRVALPGGWAAVAETDGLTARIGYEGPDGTPCKSLPPAVRQDADALAELKKDLKAIRATVANERSRLDACLAAGRSWPLAQWRRLYLGHPVTGRLTRRFIWTFGSDAEPDRPLTGIPVSETTLMTSDGTEAPLPDDDQVEVRAWHPVHAAAEDVQAWRRLLLGQRITQPVKQSFREVYVLTPAEEETRDYSNRFAGHIFQQQQARALLKARSWAPVPLAPWDNGIDHGVARRKYPQPDGQVVRAEFFFDEADPDDLTGNGMFRFCSSDQVRFFDEADGEAILLANVPPLVFSEAMRDIDLVIGVSSVGADPEWLNRGDGRRFRSYWHRFVFGGLGAGAEIRREVLSDLIPMLSIADRCDLEDRFLRVRGELRTYRIHLGSGNILMSPDDQYLCIVAARDARAGKVALPFDDDPVLSLILSKAFLLANDSKITDPSITRQIRPRLPGFHAALQKSGDSHRPSQANQCGSVQIADSALSGGRA